jgi:hypothetical protein
MKRNLKLGLILGIAILMVLPVYARALIILNDLQGCIAPGTIANITASQGATISFVVTSRLPNLLMISNPDAEVATFPSATNGTSTFKWPTGGSDPVAGGTYLAAFEANNGGTEVEYLVVMITIISTGGSPPPAPTETISVSFSNPTTTGTSGAPVSFTASATSSLGGDSFQYNFIWGDGTLQTGFGSASQSHTYNTTTTQTYTVTVQAKCSTHSVSGQASTPITITGSGGSGGGDTGALGSKTNPIKVNKYSIKGGYMPSISPDNSRGYVEIPAYTKWYFEVDPLATTGKSATSVAMGAKFYGGGGLVCQLTQDKITGAYTPEKCGGYTSFMVTFPDNKPYDLDNTKFLFAIDNSGGSGVARDEVGASIFYF